MSASTEAQHRFYDDPPMTKEGKPIKLTAEQQAFWAGYELAMLDVAETDNKYAGFVD